MCVSILVYIYVCATGKVVAPHLIYRDAMSGLITLHISTYDTTRKTVQYSAVLVVQYIIGIYIRAHIYTMHSIYLRDAPTMILFYMFVVIIVFFNKRDNMTMKRMREEATCERTTQTNLRPMSMRQ